MKKITHLLSLWSKSLAECKTLRILVSRVISWLMATSKYSKDWTHQAWERRSWRYPWTRKISRRCSNRPCNHTRKRLSPRCKLKTPSRWQVVPPLKPLVRASSLPLRRSLTRIKKIMTMKINSLARVTLQTSGTT